MTCRIYSLANKQLVRSLVFKETIQMVKLASSGNIIAYCTNSQSHRISRNTFRYLYLYSLNGKLLNVEALTETIHDMILSASGNIVLTGGSSGSVIGRSTNNFDVICSFISPTTVRSLSLVAEDSFLFVGLENGCSYIFPFPAK